MGSKPITNKELYERETPDGDIYGRIMKRDINRFKDTSKHIHPQAMSLLDVGCCCGEWLNYICEHYKLNHHLGIDIAENRVNEAKRMYPELNVKVSSAEKLDFSEKSFDVVTCLEVLEHIPDWSSIFNSLFHFASKQVLITVPYCEKITYSVCIHCGKSTPLWGHLRSYSEDSFPKLPGWSLSFAKIAEKNPESTLARRVYRLFKPYYPWLLIDYRYVG